MLVHQSLVNLRFVFLLVLFYLSVVDTGVLFRGCIVFVYVLLLWCVGVWYVVLSMFLMLLFL